MFIWLAKEPKSGGDRLDCLTQLFLVAPHLVLKLINEEGFRAIARTKIWERVNLRTKSKIRSLTKTCSGNQCLQRGNRIIVIEDFFATPFSKLLR